MKIGSSLPPVADTAVRATSHREATFDDLLQQADVEICGIEEAPHLTDVLVNDLKELQVQAWVTPWQYRRADVLLNEHTIRRQQEARLKDLVAQWDAFSVAKLREAGAVFTDLEGRAPGLETTSVLAATPALHGELLERLRS